MKNAISTSTDAALSSSSSRQGASESLVVVFQNSIMHGSTPIRVDAAVCFKYLVQLSKPDAMKKELIKICGALVRVVNDKFPPSSS